MARPHLAPDAGTGHAETAAFEALVARIASRLDGSAALTSWITDDSDRRAMILAIIQDVGSFVLRWVDGEEQATNRARGLAP